MKKLLLTLLLVALSPLVILALTLYGLATLVLHLVMWLVWSPWGTRVIMVYSDSPVWKEHIEASILPRLPRTAIVMNWSDRRRWNTWKLETLVFRFFGGSREFNPMGIVVRPFRWARCFRFWKPFREYKHGKPEALERLEESFFGYLAGGAGESTPGRG